MRVAIIADSHFAEDNRFEECQRLHAWIAADARARGVKLVLHSGDIYERASTPLERQAASHWVASMADFAPVAVVKGNHDAERDVQLMTRIRARHLIHVVESCVLAKVLTADEQIVNVACLAWPRKADVMALARERGLDAGTVGQEALRAVLVGMGAEMERDAAWPRILLAHAMVCGSVTSTAQPLVGCDFELSLADLALARSDFVALGHIHKHQAWEHGGVPIVYPGAPRRTDFGMDHPVGYVVAEVERGSATWEFVEAPATQMVLVELEWFDSALRGHEPDVAGAEVRLRYVVDSHARDAARAAAERLADRWRSEGAVLVQVEERVRAETRARAPEVAAATTLADKLEAYWRSKSFDPGERRPMLLAKLAELEGAVR